MTAYTRETGIAIVIVVIAAICLFVLGMWFLITGIVGVATSGASGWEAFKIVTGIILIGGVVSGGSHG